MPPHVQAKQISAVRQFSRFFTRKIGVLDESLHATGFSLAEARLLFEMAQSPTQTASQIAETLNLDPGYLSRIIAAIERKGLIVRTPSKSDARQMDLQLSIEGQRAFARLDAASQSAVGSMLGALTPAHRKTVVDAMLTIEAHLADGGAQEATQSQRSVVLRSLRPGDIGWVISRHGALYAEEYGWDQTFEALVAKIAAGFVEKHDPEREAAWIAEIDGATVGSAFVVTHSKQVAKLRLVYVEPSARGAGVGERLVREAMAFAKMRGYTHMTLWTNDVLIAARRLYQRLGFKMTQSEAYHGFGKDLVSETWERDLGDI